MTNDGFKLLRRSTTRVAQINLVMHSLIRNIKNITLFFHKPVHRLNRSWFIIIRSDMHALHTQAFIIGEDFIGDDCACLVLGDNIFYGQGFVSILKQAVKDAEENAKATVFGYWVADPQRYGVAEFDADGKCLSIEEKPQNPKSNYAVVGLYFYPNKVVDIAKSIKPSARGELEITTVNQEFLSLGELKVQTLGRGFAWLDTGTHDSLSEASTFIEVIEKRQGLKIACLETIAYRKGWITKEKLREVAQPMAKNQYGQYLLRVANE